MNRFVSAIFCDDIRQEIGNKQSYIGVYHGDLLVPQFPIALSKLCVVVNISTPRDQPFNSLLVRILKGESPLTEIPLPGDQIATGQKAIIDRLSDKEAEGFISFVVMFAFSPLPFESPTKIRVRVIADGVELKAGGLEVKKVESVEAMKATA